MGRRTIKTRSVWKEDGTVMQGNEDLAKRWSEHFQKVLKNNTGRDKVPTVERKNNN